jgi:hypothetical protein
MYFQQNMAARRVEHNIAGFSCVVAVEDNDCGWTAVWPLVSGCAAPDDRAHGAAVEAIAAVGWCGLARRARHGGASATVMERKASRRRSRGRRAGAMAEPDAEHSHGDA